jgi:hypothetical protein
MKNNTWRERQVTCLLSHTVQSFREHDSHRVRLIC